MHTWKDTLHVKFTREHTVTMPSQYELIIIYQSLCLKDVSSITSEWHWFNAFISLLHSSECKCDDKSVCIFLHAIDKLWSLPFSWEAVKKKIVWKNISCNETDVHEGIKKHVQQWKKQYYDTHSILTQRLVEKCLVTVKEEAVEAQLS